MAPSTRPSMYNDSEPVTSPLITSDLPMVACSWLLRSALRGAAAGVGSLKVGCVLIVGFSGSGLIFGLGLGLLLGELAGFHIAKYFLSSAADFQPDCNFSAAYGLLAARLVCILIPGYGHAAARQ